MLNFLAALGLLLAALVTNPAEARFAQGGASSSPSDAAESLPFYISTNVNDQWSAFDDNGNKVDAETANVFVWHGQTYIIGDTWGCGRAYLQSYGTPATCGLNVYQMYADPAGKVHYTLLGQPYDKATTDCSGVGCFGAILYYKANTDTYYLWSLTNTAPQGYLVWACSNITQMTTMGCVEQTPPTHFGHGSQNSDITFCTDRTSGNVYALYEHFGSGATTFAQQMADPPIDATGSDFQTGFSGEGLGCAQDGSGAFQVLYGPACEFCSTGTISTITSTSPLTSWTGGGTINSSACNGQAHGINPGPTVLTSSPQPYFMIDRWAGQFVPSSSPGLANQALDNFYFTPITLAGGTISSFACQASVSMVLPVRAAPTPYWNGALTGTEQLGGGFGVNGNTIDIGGLEAPNQPLQRLQTFTMPTSTSSITALITLDVASNCVPHGAACTGAPNANLIATLYPISSGCTISGAALASTSVSPSLFSWSPKPMALNFTAALVSGQQYGIVLSSPSNTVTGAAYGWAGNNDTGNFTTGTHCYSRDGGTTWNVDSGRAIKFSIYNAVTSPAVAATAGPTACSGDCTTNTVTFSSYVTGKPFFVYIGYCNGSACSAAMGGSPPLVTGVTDTAGDTCSGISGTGSAFANSSLAQKLVICTGGTTPGSNTITITGANNGGTMSYLQGWVVQYTNVTGTAELGNTYSCGFSGATDPACASTVSATTNGNTSVNNEAVFSGATCNASTLTGSQTVILNNGSNVLEWQLAATSGSTYSNAHSFSAPGGASTCVEQIVAIK